MSGTRQSTGSGRKPHLAYLITDLGYGGAEIGMVRLLDELHERGYQITVISLRDEPDDVSSSLPGEIPVHRLGLEFPPRATEVVRAARAIRRTDVLVSSLFHAAVLGTIATAALGNPAHLTWQHHTRYFGTGRRSISRRCYARADAVLADSKAVARMLDGLGVPGAKTHTLPIAGVDMEEFRSREPAAGDELRVGTVGRLVPEKGYDTLLDCAARLDGGLSFHVVGDGPLREDLEARARRATGAEVTFHGRVPDEQFRELLGGFDIYCQPSRAEGLCMTAIEAMACELPVVASDIDGLSESVVDGETGYLVPPDDLDAFVDRIERLRDDPELRCNLGRRGRERVAEHYSKEAFADAFEDVLRAVDAVRAGEP